MSRLSQAMGTNRARKRSDYYPTIDIRAVPALTAAMAAAGDVRPDRFPVRYAEPCAGTADLIHLLDRPGFDCVFGLELDPHDEGLRNRWPIARGNALALGERDLAGVDLFITNPPWDRPLLHPIIRHLASLRPTWLLFDASWCFTKQSAPFARILTDVAAVGRLKWFAPKGPPMRIEGESEASYAKRVRKAKGNDAADDCAWYRFCEAEASDEPPRFHLPVKTERQPSPQAELAFA